MKTFLNITPERPACRQLIFALLSFLGRIMLFFRIQRKYRFYSSSLLVAYDARKLRQCCRFDSEDPNDQMYSRDKPAFFPSMSRTTSGTNVSEQVALIASVSNAGTKRNWMEAQRSRPILKRSVSLSGSVPIACEQILNRSGFYSPDFKINRMCRSCPGQFSLPCTNNVTIKDIRNIENNCNWVRVNMIDFTHVFPADDSDLDLNYLEGIENLIKLLSTFIKRVRKREQDNSCATIAQ